MVSDDSLEDCFIIKLIANRAEDADGCTALISAGLDFDVVYGVIGSQYCKDGLAASRS